jgi:hypothetical protein
MRLTLLKIRLLALSCGIVCLIGCTRTRTVYVPHGEPVRLAEPVEAEVWVNTKDGERKSKLTIPEGWWALPDEKDDGKETKAPD